MHGLTVAVDFDNCLVEYADNPLGEFILKPDARGVIGKDHSQGVRFILNTSRYGRYLLPAIKFIKEERLPIEIRLSLSKISADLYIDDHNIFCKEVNWRDVDRELRRILDVQSKQENGDKCISST